MQIKIDEQTRKKVKEMLDSLGVSAGERKCVEHIVISFEDWFIAGHVTGKIANSKDKLFGEWIPKLRKKGIELPVDDEELVELITSQPDYKNRAEREKETKP